MRPSILLATAASAVVLSVATVASASANTFCVHQTGSCPAGSVDKGSDLQAALGDADGDGQATTIDVLAGTYAGPFLTFSDEPLVIAGAGSASTILTGGSTVLQAGCTSCAGGTFAVHDLGLRLTTTASTGLTLFGSFDAHSIAVTSTATGALTGVKLTDTATLEQSSIALATASAATTTAIHVQGINAASDLTLAGDIGAEVVATANLALSHAIIDADVDGVDSHGGSTTVDNTLIRLSGDSATGLTSIATGVNSVLSVVNSTILATGTNDVGLFLSSEGAATGNHGATANMTNSIMWGVTLTGSCLRGLGGPVPALILRYSDLDPGGSLFNCSPTITHPLSAPPGFLTPTDPRLPRTSPLIDQGDPALATPSGATDLGGGARVADGDGDGTAIRDVGAYEYGRRPPVTHASAPASATAGQALTFDAAGSFDPDPGETLSYHWDFGDGGTAATAVASHAFTGAGAHTATASATDPTGQTTSAQVIVTIPGPTGPGGTTVPPGPVTVPGPAKVPPATTHPAARKLTLTVGTATIGRLLKGLRVTAALTGAGTVTVTLKAGKRTLATKRITFTRAGKRVVSLKLSKRLAATVSRSTRVRATLSATIAGSTSSAISKHLVLHR